MLKTHFLLPLQVHIMKMHGYKITQELLLTCLERDRHVLAPATKDEVWTYKIQLYQYGVITIITYPYPIFY